MSGVSLNFRNLSVGYGKKPIIKDISLQIEKGEVVALLGPNGGGKSTLLKTISRQLSPLSGKIYLTGEELASISPKNLAQRMAVLLTKRVRPELMTVFEVAAMGRYPYTGRFGKLSDRDESIVNNALSLTDTLCFADQQFSQLSDGQQQRVLLARAIAQQPKLLLLDEPTSFLDIRYKSQLLAVIRRMAEEGTTILLSIHEPELAYQVADRLICLKDGAVMAVGSPEELFANGTVNRLYNLGEDRFNPLLGGLAPAKPTGTPKVFVLGGNGLAVHHYHLLQKYGIPFVTGVLFENDIDYFAAKRGALQLFSSPAFAEIPEDLLQKSKEALLSVGLLLDVGVEVRENNAFIEELRQFAAERRIPVFATAYEVVEHLKKAEKSFHNKL